MSLYRDVATSRRATNTAKPPSLPSKPGWHSCTHCLKKAPAQPHLKRLEARDPRRELGQGVAMEIQDAEIGQRRQVLRQVRQGVVGQIQLPKRRQGAHHTDRVGVQLVARGAEPLQAHQQRQLGGQGGQRVAL